MAIFSWEGVSELPMPIRHVHGDRDGLIPIRRVHPDDVITGGGHLLNLTHTGAINDFLANADRQMIDGIFVAR